MKYILIFLVIAGIAKQSLAQQKVTIGGPGTGGGGADGGVIVMKAVGTTANANGATIIADTLQLQPASISFAGVVKPSTGLGITGDGTLTGKSRIRINTAGSTFEADRLNIIQGTGITLGVNQASGDNDLTISASSSSTWNGVFGGSSAPSASATFPGVSDNVQYISKNTAPATFTLPSFAANGNRAYFIKNEGTSTLTVQRPGVDNQLYTDAAVNSITIPVGESRLIMSGVSYWHVHNMPAAGGGGSGANITLSNLGTTSINTALIAAANNTYDLGTTTIAWKDVYSYTQKFKGATSGTATLQAPAVAGTPTITLPSVTGTLSTLAGTETLTNKTLGVTTFNGAVNFGGQTIENYLAKYNNQTGTSYTLLSSDNGKIVTLSNAGAITLTVPAGLPIGFNATVVQLGAGLVTFTASGTTINNRQFFTRTAGQYAVASIISRSTNNFITGGDMQ